MANLTALQVQAAKAIVNIFETSAVLGDYSNVTVAPHDTGHLTFGRSQTTLATGNLGKLLHQYCSSAAARFSARLNGWMARVDAKDPTLDSEPRFHNLLRATADDAVMRQTQDAFFDTDYWQFALQSAANAGIVSPLGVAIVYDSTIQGSWGLVSSAARQHSGTVAGLGEQAWLRAYVAARRIWLATNSNPALQPTVYRMEAFQALMNQGHWNLDLPLVVRGLEISDSSLVCAPPHCYDGPEPGTRALAVQSPLLRGMDVRLLQLGLSNLGQDILADGVFGPGSQRAVRTWQMAAGKAADGVAAMDQVSLLARS